MLSKSTTADKVVHNMHRMDWTSPDGIAALAVMKKNGNLAPVVADKIRKNRVWVESHQRGGVDVEGHFRQIGSKVRDAAQQTMPHADFSNIDQKSATRAAAYGGIGAGAVGLGAHYIRSRPTLAAAYGLYGLANLFGAGQQAHQSMTMNKRDVISKVREVKNSQEFDAFMEEMSEASGIRPEQIIEDFGEWLRENKISADDVTAEVFHEFMVTSYGHEQEPEQPSPRKIKKAIYKMAGIDVEDQT